MLPDVLFLDEPELGLHPHAINLVAAGLKRVAQRRQVFIATQSPYMVDCFELENMIVARLTDDGSTTLNTLDHANSQQWLDDEYQLSELWLTDFQTKRHQASRQSKILLLGLITTHSEHGWL